MWFYSKHSCKYKYKFPSYGVTRTFTQHNGLCIHAYLFHSCLCTTLKSSLSVRINLLDVSRESLHVPLHVGLRKMILTTSMYEVTIWNLYVAGTTFTTAQTITCILQWHTHKIDSCTATELETQSLPWGGAGLWDCNYAYTLKLCTLD